MGLDHKLDRSALRAFTIHTVDINYLTWFVSNQHLFGPHPSSYMVGLSHLNMTPEMLRKSIQTSAVRYNITVHASGVEGGAVHIPEVPYDAGLRQSFISTENAQATHGLIVQTETALSLQGADEKIYRSSSYITLTWWMCGDSLSHIEDFYITEDLPRNCRAMLRRAPDDAAHGNKALPLFNKVQTAGTLPSGVLIWLLTDTCFMLKEEKKRAEERRKREENAHTAIRQVENQKIEDKTRNLNSTSPKQSSNHFKPSYVLTSNATDKILT